MTESKWRRWTMLPAMRRDQARDRAQEMLARHADRLTDDERERVELLLMWLDRTEPSRLTTFPGRGDGVHSTCVAEIEALWSEVQARS